MSPRWPLLAFLVVAGCSNAVDVRPTEPTRQRLIALGRAYGQTIGRGKTPATLADLEPALKEMGNPDELTKSPRDGQPFVILWGTKLTEAESKVFMYEKEGRGGTRFVLKTDGA